MVQGIGNLTFRTNRYKVRASPIQYLLTEDEGDLIPLDMLDDVIIDAVAALCEKQNIEYHSPSYDGEEPSGKQKEIEKLVRDSVEYVYILG